MGTELQGGGLSSNFGIFLVLLTCFWAGPIFSFTAPLVVNMASARSWWPICEPNVLFFLGPISNILANFWLSGQFLVIRVAFSMLGPFFVCLFGGGGGGSFYVILAHAPLLWQHNRLFPSICVCSILLLDLIIDGCTL